MSMLYGLFRSHKTFKSNRNCSFFSGLVCQISRNKIRYDTHDMTMEGRHKTKNKWRDLAAPSLSTKEHAGTPKRSKRDPFAVPGETSGRGCWHRTGLARTGGVGHPTPGVGYFSTRNPAPPSPPRSRGDPSRGATGSQPRSRGDRALNCRRRIQQERVKN